MRLLLSTILIAFTVAACEAKPNDPQADRSFSTWQPCVAPCWYRLEPNESTIKNFTLFYNYFHS